MYYIFGSYLQHTFCMFTYNDEYSALKNNNNSPIISLLPDEEYPFHFTMF